ncbi:MAG: hypothetical protein J5883_01990 [Clostridiales bacterium]|nr:hypothetical protein [Clostridiales bacterium]
MKDRFDEQLTEEFKEKLGSIHASDDLIARTLQRLAEEQSAEDESENEDVTLTAIDPGYITSHITRKKKHSNRIIMFIAAAVTLATVGGGIFLASQIRAKKNASTNCLTTGATVATAATVSGSSSASPAAGSAQLLRADPERVPAPRKLPSNVGYYDSRAVYSVYDRDLPRI